MPIEFVSTAGLLVCEAQVKPPIPDSLSLDHGRALPLGSTLTLMLLEKFAVVEVDHENPIAPEEVSRLPEHGRIRFCIEVSEALPQRHDRIEAARTKRYVPHVRLNPPYFGRSLPSSA
ncbi:MAG TPA: hypothetical protein VGB92_20025 [Longimicrobium sp.]